MTTAAAPTPADTGFFAALRYRDYSLFWVAAMISNTGTWMQTITAPFVVYELTHSAFWVGFAAFMAFGPALLISPLAGSLADRLPRKQVLLGTQVASMIVAFALWGAVAADVASVAVIIALLCVSGAASGLNIASWQSFVPQLVPPEAMLNAVRLNSMQFTAARAFGPLLAGWVLSEFGASTAFMTNALSFILVIAALLAITPRPIKLPTEIPSVREHFKAGVAYVRRTQGLVLAVMTITLVSLLGTSILQLAAPYAVEVLHVGEDKYAYLVGAFGVGAIVGSFLTVGLAERVSRARLASIGLVLFSVGEVVTGAAPEYAVALGSLAAMGVAYILVAVSLNTSVQARVDEDHRGRVVSIYLMGLMVGVPLGSLIGGVAAEVIGLRAAIIGAGAILAAFTAYALTRYDGMRPLDEGIPGSSVPAAEDALDNPLSIAGAD